MAFKHLDTVIHKVTGASVLVWDQIDADIFLASDGTIYCTDEFYDVSEDDVSEDDASDAIVILFENGKLKPATNPFIHPSREAAEVEARRLAEANPGQGFIVFVESSISRADRPKAATYPL